MKKIMTLFFVMTAAYTAHAQSVTLLSFGGYTFQQKIRYSNADIKIGNGFQWGGLEIGINDSKAIELIYQRMDPQVRATYYGIGAPDPESVDAGVNYIMVGGTNYFPLNDMLSAFGTVDLGVMFANPKNRPNLDGMTRFAWGIRGGLKASLSEVISLRIHAQLFSPVEAFGGGVWFGSGGSGGGISTYSTIYQFDLGGSLNIKIK